MDDKEEQKVHIQLDGKELVFFPAESKLKETLTEADLRWLTDEIGKRLAGRMRSGLGVRA